MAYDEVIPLVGGRLLCNVLILFYYLADVRCHEGIVFANSKAMVVKNPVVSVRSPRPREKKKLAPRRFL
jgi:hypothetical protein